MLCHGLYELVEDETLIVQLGRLAQLEILSDELDWARDLADLKGVVVCFRFSNSI